ncbi:DUF3137 domain-containing protein [Aquimarina sp. I32.4]|uniref:DUF3137 domain-containing protein n=1 Tax=Aquimarina sp. I32.4 TaxID=2053903 RepID=UPI000CDED57A|nr:DUF3137 domain-containing protein [Aquimarina sp. I32.4]
MNQISEHFEAVKKQASTIKPPSKLRLIGSSLLVLASVLAFIIAIVCFFIGIIVWIIQYDTDVIFLIAKSSFKGSIGGWIFAILIFRSYFKDTTKFKNTSVLRQDFKMDILPQMIASTYGDLKYQFDGIVHEDHILESGFFPPSFLTSLKERWFFGDDYFSGKIENVDFEFCELYYKTKGVTISGWAIIIIMFTISISLLFRSDIDLPSLGIGDDESFFDTLGESKQKRVEQKTDRTKVNQKAFLYGTKTNFRGFFMYADFHKDFEGIINIRTKKKFGIPKMFNVSKTMNKIRVENASVNKKYTIRATNTQMAYYVLSPTIVEAIDKLSTRLGKHLSMTLKDGKLYLIAPMNKDFFENVTIDKNSISVNTIEDIQNDLNAIRDLITTLNISNRIWTKA